ncbi:pentapeptide repeat-containing protein [Enterococcus sp. BWB1-3]|uniref:pentapeptide repeat-containing protein n=1 Tax=Enterococcus sp. BWB1-3 TaxID=2787713 RepID=UPI0019228923|nr:pentapeptide repeat-containing protein [Enterococcus sp. BWB1-3]MBL1230533.1 pentapeptide repeat-containing protein [Enterococcus sp. BWB1-3]
MIQTKQIKVFQRDYVEPLLQHLIQKLDADFREHKEQLKIELKEQLCALLSKEPFTAKDGEIGFLVVSWLRSSYLFQEKLIYDVHIYNSNWYYDPTQVQGMFRFSWLEEYFDRFSSGIQKMIGEQSAVALLGQEDYYLKIYFDVFHNYFIELLRYVWKTDRNELLKKHQTATSFYVFAGEYKGESVPVFQQLPRLTQYEFQGLWDNQLLDFDESKNLGHLNLMGIDFSGKAITSLTFDYSQLNEGKLSDCLLVNSSFNHACLDGAAFDRSKLQDASFVSASCIGTSFRAAIGNQASLLEALPCYFGVNFMNANLSQADFLGANMLGACFENASMKGTRFFETERQRLVLSEQQKRDIEWVKE